MGVILRRSGIRFPFFFWFQFALRAVDAQLGAAFINRGATHAQEATQSEVVLALSKDFAINLQLLGGVWILQTLPAIVIGLYTRRLHR